jgi:hypothetical protein
MDRYPTSRMMGHSTVLFTSRTYGQNPYCPAAVLSGRGSAFTNPHVRYYYSGTNFFSTREFTLAAGGGCVMVVFEQSFPLYSMNAAGRMRGRISGQDLVLIVGNSSPHEPVFVPRGTSLAELDRKPQIKTFFTITPRHQRTAAMFEAYRHAARLAAEHIDDSYEAQAAVSLSAIYQRWARDLDNLCTCPAGSHETGNIYDYDEGDDNNDYGIFSDDDVNNW